jgi:hypothetical protein
MVELFMILMALLFEFADLIQHVVKFELELLHPMPLGLLSAHPTLRFRVAGEIAVVHRFNSSHQD